MFKIQYYILFAGIWAVGNGILHDIFVLRQGRPFEKELIRLLIDGHILIFSGIFYLLCYKGISNNDPLTFYMAIAISIFLLGYCALIFKMLPSIGMIVVNLVALVWLLIEMRNI
jgi:hypothetical protein